VYVWSAVQADSKLHYIPQESVVGSKNKWAIDHKDEIFGSKNNSVKMVSRYLKKWAVVVQYKMCAGNHRWIFPSWNKKEPLSP
jgi:NADPH-dependent 2,4-dienoyl-CoA reductase/sulfur reductase-like enzyme